jgi:hypothetical protein
MKSAEIKSLITLARMESQGCFKNSTEFAQKQFEKHFEQVKALSEKVYNAYLPKGESVARERQELYISQNLKKVSDFI